MNEYAIELSKIRKNFGRFTLGPLDLKIPTGAIVGLIGQNGAGKSTTMKLILGLLRPDAGDFRILGQENPQALSVKERIGVVFEDLFVSEELTAAQLQKFSTGIYQSWDQAMYTDFLTRFHLSPNQPIKEYSRGMKMKLSIALALSHRPEVLLMDEPTSGLDPVVREEILDILLEYMQEESHTVLISSHILSDLEKIADYIAFIDAGQVIFMEAKDELQEIYGICHVSEDEESILPSEAIIARRSHAFGQELLVKKQLMPRTVSLQKPSIEDIMVFMAKKEERR